eukprot:UN04281
MMGNNRLSSPFDTFFNDPFFTQPFFNNTTMNNPFNNSMMWSPFSSPFTNHRSRRNVDPFFF